MKIGLSVFTLLQVALAIASDTSDGEDVSFEPFNQSLLSSGSFFEQFLQDLPLSSWVVSPSKKKDAGKWEIEPAFKYPGYLNDKGLVLKTPEAHHAVSHKLDTPFDNTDNDLVLQYEVKTQNGLSCGGAYIKLFNKDFNPNKELTSDTPFQLMFGPDKCGEHDKVTFIINRLNPINKKLEQKHLSETPIIRSTQLSSLYTLVFKRNSDFEIRINGKVEKAGNLLKEPHLISPSLNAPELIVDPKDSKPTDWEELEFIPDESAEKPADYDEKFGKSFVADPNVVKPDGWLEDEPEYILDPFASKPEEWDDEEDGEWEVPVIKNPKCDVGCGKWEAPLIANPTYKGPWIHPVIENPNYKGEWKPRMIPNPNFYEDKNPSNLDLIGGIGFELFSLQEDILFDNIYLGHSVKEAEYIGNSTFLPKFEIELKDYEAKKPKAVKEPSPPPKAFDELYEEESGISMINQILTFFGLVFKREILNMQDFWYIFMRDPLNTLLEDPLIAVVYSGVFVFLFTLVFGTLNVLMYVYQDWIQETKDAINKGAEAARADIEGEKDNEEVPKIVEINDQGESVALTSSQKTKGNATRRRK